MDAPFLEGEPTGRRFPGKQVVDRGDDLTLPEDFMRKTSEALPRDFLEAIRDQFEPRPPRRRASMAVCEAVWLAAERC